MSNSQQRRNSVNRNSFNTRLFSNEMQIQTIGFCSGKKRPRSRTIVVLFDALQTSTHTARLHTAALSKRATIATGPETPVNRALMKLNSEQSTKTWQILHRLENGLNGQDMLKVYRANNVWFKTVTTIISKFLMFHEYIYIFQCSLEGTYCFPPSKCHKSMHIFV